MAQKLKSILEKENLLCSSYAGDDEFLVSDLTASFEQSARFFYGHDIDLQLKTLQKK